MDRRVLLLFFALFLGGTRATKLRITNNCKDTVWIAISSNLSGPRLPELEAGFELITKSTRTLEPPYAWAGQIWARTKCSYDPNGSLICATGDCGTGSILCGALPMPPITLVEITLGTNGGPDSFDTSLLAGFNTPVSVTPQGGEGCKISSCPADVNAICPQELRVGEEGGAIACKSGCQAFLDPRNCCSENYAGPKNCKPTNYTEIFKSACPLASSYPYDSSGNFTCTGATTYLITFCP